MKRFLPKSEFGRNVLTLMTGTIIAQAIPIIISPILTRIYTPDDFGLLALFIALTSILGSVANGRYELAIMLPEKDEDAINIAALSLLIAIILFLILFFVVLLFDQIIVDLIGNQNLKFWLYFIPFIVLITGLNNVLNYLSTRKRKYKDLSVIFVYRSLIGAIAQISIGILKSGATGLVAGQILSQVVASFRLSLNLKNEYEINKIKFKRINSLGFLYKDFLVYSIVGSLANILVPHIVNISISSSYNTTILGFFYIAQRILCIPSMIAGSSFSQVFYQAAIKEKQTTGSCVNIYKKVFSKLVFLSVIFFLPLYFIAGDMFTLFFGREWEMSGNITIILLPLVAMQFIASTLSVVFNVFEEQKLTCIWQVALLVISLGVVLISHRIKMNFQSFLTFYSWTATFMYALYLYLSFRIACGGKKNPYHESVDNLI